MKWHHIPVALALLTRIPLHLRTHWFDDAARAHWAYPLVGVIVGLILSVIASLSLGIGLSAQMTAGITIGAAALLTGAMHYDGLADLFDGFWGGMNIEDRLAIMKDSHIGTYGVMALVISIGLTWQGLTQIFASGSVAAPLITIAALSRAAILIPMNGLPHARKTGLARLTGRASTGSVWIAWGIALLAALLMMGGMGLLAALIAYLVGYGVSQLSLTKIGGQTGDVLGATQQLATVALCCVFSIY